MEAAICTSCQKPKAHFICGICKTKLCKSCVQLLTGNSFSFLQPCPEQLTHGAYCGSCFNEKVAPELESYQEVMVRAENIIVFFKTQGKETRLIKRAEKSLTVTDCEDRDETLLRLAFLAAKANFNGLIDVEITAEKVFDHAYQTKKWSGKGVPAHLDAKKYAPES